MRVAVGGLIRDRIPQLRIYLRHLRRLETDGVDVRWLFLLDNCGPDAAALVRTAFPEAMTPEIRDRGKAYDRDRSRQHKRMAELRNRFRSEVLRGGLDGMLSVDSDIVVTPDLLRRLLAAGRPWICAVVDNSRGKRIVFNLLNRRPTVDEFRWAAPDLVHGGEVDAIGAACFYRRDLLERAEFAYDRQGEDLGFARQARAAGVRGAYLPLELEHLMVAEQTAGHLRRCEVCQR